MKNGEDVLQRAAEDRSYSFLTMVSQNIPSVYSLIL